MLETGLDKWIYSLKNAGKMTTEPVFAEEMNLFFESARCANFTKEELEMYRTAKEEEWDNQNALDFAKEKAMLTKAIEIALVMLKEGVDIDQIVKWTKLSREQVLAL